MDNLVTPDNRRQLDKKLQDFLKDNNSSVELLNNYINEKCKKYGSREAVVNAALAITYDLEKRYGIKLPYTYCGGHKNVLLDVIDKDEFVDGMTIGVNPNWGYRFNEQERELLQHKDGTIYLSYGLDCSGFIAWVLYNGGFNYLNRSAKDLKEGIEYVSPIGDNHDLFVEKDYIGKEGDLLYYSGHIMIIVKVDYRNGNYYLAEAKNGKEGVKISKYSIKDLTRESKYTLIDMTKFYTDKNNLAKRLER